ncbi:PH-like domain-containing protein [Streptacidiphilus cavernicola]|uniref:PH domain-containing protein n=1 Tax=Streptacidiphilus cavernicola TaxID=3342716 RepID=A0ABV6VQI7_9ACTN
MSLPSLLAETPHSAPVTHVSDLVGWIVGLLVLIGLIYWLMRQGWLWRRTQQSGIPALPVAPKHTTQTLLELEGRYLGTTTAGDWLDRVVAHRLGERSLVELTLSAEGLNVVRPASSSFFVPVAELRGARTDRGIAGKVVPEGGLLVVTWEHGGKQLDTGVRADHPAEHESWVTAIEVLMRAHAKVTGEISIEHTEGA